MEMCCAIQRPPRTARLVQRAWPSVPPIITPITSCTPTCTPRVTPGYTHKQTGSQITSQTQRSNKTGTHSTAKCAYKYHISYFLYTCSNTQVHSQTQSQTTSHTHTSNKTGAHSTAKCASEYHINYFLYTCSNTQVHSQTHTVTKTCRILYWDNLKYGHGTTGVLPRLAQIIFRASVVTLRNTHSHWYTHKHKYT